MRVKPLEGDFSAEKSYETLNPSKVQLKGAADEETKKDEPAVQDCEPVKKAMTDDTNGDGSGDSVQVKAKESWKSIPMSNQPCFAVFVSMSTTGITISALS